VDHLRDYDAVVVGSTVEDGQWLPIASQFLIENAGALAGKPLWLFGVWLPSALPGPLHRAICRAQVRSLAAAVPVGIQPRDMRLFGGALRPEQVPARADRVRLHALGIRYGDFRPWPEVMAWARQIAVTLDGVNAA
jgi:menaquinone-dependent protoporphyrinogen oxidase